jgi:putative aldouronate transport system permease protein
MDLLKRTRNIRQNYNLYLMLIIPLIGFAIFQYAPILYSVIVGFKHYDLSAGLIGSPWVGFKYFIQFLDDPFFPRLIRNTFLLGLYTLIWGFPVPIILALLLNEVRINSHKKFVQSAIYFPYFISVVVVVGILYNLLSSEGVINSLIEVYGGKTIGFFINPAFFRALYVGSEIWQKAGWASVIYLAALASIKPELYEAAVVDGANRWQTMWHISLAGIRPIISIMLILNVGNMLNVAFEKVLLMYSPGIYEVSDVLQTYVYRRGILGLEFGYGGAVNLFNSAISIAMLVIANCVARKVSEEMSIW